MADEDLHPALVATMRAHAWDVVSVAEREGLRGSTDEELYREAARLGRLLVTADSHFVDDSRFPLRGGPGLLVLEGRGLPERMQALSAAALLIQRVLDLEKDVLPWNKWIASPSRIRSRGICRSGEYFDDIVWQDGRWMDLGCPGSS